MYQAKFDFVNSALGQVHKDDPIDKSPITDQLYKDGYLDLAESKSEGDLDASSDEASAEDSVSKPDVDDKEGYDTKVVDQKPTKKDKSK